MKKTQLLALVGMAFCASQAWAQKDGRGVLLGLRDGREPTAQSSPAPAIRVIMTW